VFVNRIERVGSALPSAAVPPPGGHPKLAPVRKFQVHRNTRTQRELISIALQSPSDQQKARKSLSQIRGRAQASTSNPASFSRNVLLRMVYMERVSVSVRNGALRNQRLLPSGTSISRISLSNSSAKQNPTGRSAQESLGESLEDWAGQPSEGRSGGTRTSRRGC
jgi:hypothetical protein